MGNDAGRQYSLPLVTPQALGRRDFQVAACNREALAWLNRWPDWPSPILVVSGPAGSGKTHLAHIFREISGGQFLDPAGLADQLEAGRVVAASAWILDDMDRHLQEREAETALFHLYNRAMEQGSGLLLTGREPAARWPVTLADLRSRLRAAPTVSIDPPDDALLAAVVVKMFADRQIRVTPEVITYLLPRMERSFHAARELVARLDRAALEAKRPVTVPLARRLLEDDEV